jgi:uncharacterized protein YidB (DUF937 family)
VGKVIKILIPVALLALVASIIVTGVALAQSGGGTPEPNQGSTTQDTFLSNVASHLGISVDQLKQAIKDADLDMVDQALQDGKITQDQADQLRQRIEEGNGFGFRFRLNLGLKVERFESLQSIVNSVASELNLSPSDILDQLKQGKTLAEIADAQGVSRDDLKSTITTSVGEAVDKAVSDGTLTQDRADQIKSWLSDNLDKIIDSTRGEGGCWGRGWGRTLPGGTFRGTLGGFGRGLNSS